MFTSLSVICLIVATVVYVLEITILSHQRIFVKYVGTLIILLLIVNIGLELILCHVTLNLAAHGRPNHVLSKFIY